MAGKPASQSAIKKLNKFTNETGISIGGCGCCGSPWIRKIKGSGHYTHTEDEGLTWVGEEETLEVESKKKELQENIQKAMADLQCLPMDNNVQYMLDNLEITIMELFENMEKDKEE